MLIGNNWNRKEQPINRQDMRISKRHSYRSNDQPTEITCNICGNSEGHVATSGPWGTKLFQYFTYKKFADATPSTRLSILREKGFCIQCLFPGAKILTGKHKDGKCQHDYVCPHPSHLKYPVKKHVLVCDEHKDQEENNTATNLSSTMCKGIIITIICQRNAFIISL